MNTVFWVTIFALALVEGANHIKVELPLLDLGGRDNVCHQLGGLREKTTREEAVSKIALVIDASRGIDGSQDREQSATMSITSHHESEVNNITEHNLPYIYIKEKNVLDSSSYEDNPECVKIEIQIPGNTDLLYIPRCGDVQPGDPVIIVVHMKGPENYTLTVRPSYHKRHSETDYSNPYGSVGYFVHMDRECAEPIIDKLISLYGDYVTVRDEPGETRYEVNLEQQRDNSRDGRSGYNPPSWRARYDVLP